MQHAVFSDKGRSADAVHALVVSKVDCYSTVLAGVSLSFTDRLQSVLNAATRLVFPARRSEHVTPLLRDWLKVPERIKFHLCVLTYYTALHCHTLPRHHNGSLTCLKVVIFGLPQRRLWSSRRLILSLYTWRPSTSCDWNSLPSLQRAVQSLTTFRCSLKAELFNPTFTRLPYCATISMRDSVHFCTVPSQRP